MRYLHTCSLNRITSKIIGLDTKEGSGIEPYVSMLIDCIVFGKEETFKHAYEFINLLIRDASVASLQVYILKLVGAIIRILNYKGNNEIKLLALKLVQISVEKGLQLQ